MADTTSPNSSPNPLESFVDYLISESGYSNLPTEYQATFRDQIRAQVYRRVGMIVMNELNDQDAQEFSQRFGDNLDQVDNGDLQQYLTSKIEDFPQKISAGLDEFAQEFFRLQQK